MKESKQHRLMGIVMIGLVLLLAGVSIKAMCDKHQERKQLEREKQDHAFFAWREK